MKSLIPLLMAFLSACASIAPNGSGRLLPPPAMSRGLAPATSAGELGATARPGNIVRLLDSRAIRAARNDIPTLNLTRQQKIGLWVGVGIVGAYLVTDWIEDEVAFFP